MGFKTFNMPTYGMSLDLGSNKGIMFTFITPYKILTKTFYFDTYIAVLLSKNLQNLTRSCEVKSEIVLTSEMLR
jgi:hypothetical protein